MSSIDAALTRQVAHLARLELTDEEVRVFTSQLGEIIGYVGQLQSVDVAGVEPLIHPFENTPPLREDRARPSPRDASGAPKVLQHAPEVLDGGFKVPPIL
jgi:aspartyl-tRNA(Asn)/glutamyl-tRNA(Gln) amidotransferase subunit C